MRRGKKPTRKQKIRLGQAGLAPENWLVVKQKANGELIILNKYHDTILHEAQIADAQKEIKVLKDATLNNMVNNVFLINFNTVTSVAITSGIYDSVARKIYV